MSGYFVYPNARSDSLLFYDYSASVQLGELEIVLLAGASLGGHFDAKK